MLMVSGPAQVSPPIKGQLNRSASANKPRANAFIQASSVLGNARESVNPIGLAPIAAKSERLTARDFFPKRNGSASAKKCLPDTSISLVIAMSSPSLGLSKAQSSPIPSTGVFSGFIWAIAMAPALKTDSMRANSPIFSKGFFVGFAIRSDMGTF